MDYLLFEVGETMKLHSHDGWIEIINKVPTMYSVPDVHERRNEFWHTLYSALNVDGVTPRRKLFIFSSRPIER